MEKYKWDLTEMFDGDEAFEAALAQFAEDMKGVTSRKGTLNTKENIKEFLLYKEALDRRAQNIGAYPRLRSDLNTKDPKTQDMVTRMIRVMTEFDMLSSFATPELLAADESVLREIVEEPEMKHFAHRLDDLLRAKKHVLSPELENMLAMTRQISSAASNAYRLLKNADTVYPDAVDSHGEKHPLTDGSYGRLIQSKNRELRRDAFSKLHNYHGEKINTFASLLESEVKKNIFYAKARGHESARHAALFANNIPVSVMDKLIDAVHQNLPAIYKAFALRKKALGVDKLHLYDTYVSIADCEFKVPYEEAKDMVKAAVRVYGPDYAKAATTGLETGWVDVYESEGKRGGAYSGGSYDSAPYILMNYNDTLNSAFTLIHELGHSMHSYYSRKNQSFYNANYSIFVAEVASTCNECLLNDYLLKTETDVEKRKYILGHFIDGFRATVYRQTMFAEFERDIHAHVEAGGSLTADFLCNHYLSLVKLYFGPDVVIDDEIKYEWARIPHFYANFYVYQYATGFAAAVALSDQVLSGNPEGALTFLSSGGSDYPINVLRNAGIDMETEEPVARALKVFANLVDEFEKLV
ncbi:MAG: oligoendopeptidase F [Bacillota bacterium]|nr:oligoendopeptidase F [Bacillota bacterium]